jgi:RNA-directed DNA polymerase
MSVSQRKTWVTAATDGFNFLGWYFRVQRNGKLRWTPAKENFNAFRKQVKSIVNPSNYGAKVKAEKLAPIVRGWKHYHRFGKMTGVGSSLSHLRLRTYRVCNRESHQNRFSRATLLEKALPSVSCSENQSIKVRGAKSPYDGDLPDWSARNSKLYDGKTSKALKQQNHSSARCGLKFMSDEAVNLHHIDGNHQNWKTSNLEAIHESCHDYIHMSKCESSDYREPDAVKVARPDLTERGEV